MEALHRIGLVLCAVLLVAGSGCQRTALDKVVVHGQVTYAGTPIPNGQIRFFPIEGTKGPISGGVIKDGQYVADGKGGVPIGRHRVEIYAYRPIKKNVPSAVQSEGGDSEQYIPAKYSGGSTLAVAISAENANSSTDFNLER